MVGREATPIAAWTVIGNQLIDLYEALASTRTLTAEKAAILERARTHISMGLAGLHFLIRNVK